MNADYDQGWEAGYRGDRSQPEAPSQDFARGYFDGFADLLASEKRWEQQS